MTRLTYLSSYRIVKREAPDQTKLNDIANIPLHTVTLQYDLELNLSRKVPLRMF